MAPETLQPQQQIPPQYHFEEDTISLLDIILVLARHLKLIIITPTILCIITIIHVLFIVEPVYVSTATFISSSSSDNKSQMMGLASQFGFSLPTGQSSPQWSYEEVIKSRTMAKSLLKHRFDTEEYGPQKELLQILTFGDEEPEFGIDTLIIQGIESVAGMIEISKTTSMFELKISASEPQLAANLTNAVMEELDAHQRAYNARKTTETREFIEERLTDTRIELETTEETLKNFRETNRNIVSSPSLQLEQERLARDVAVLTGVFTTLKQQLETAKIQEVNESDYVVILDHPEIPLYPNRPKKKFIVFISGLLGLIIAILFTIIKDSLENNKSNVSKILKAINS